MPSRIDCSCFLIENVPCDFLIQPRVFLTKLQTVIDMFIKTHQDAAPELEILAFSLPDDKVTNVTVAEEIVCVVEKLRKTFPRSLGNFVSSLHVKEQTFLFCGKTSSNM